MRPSVYQAVFSLTVKQKSLQFRNLVQGHWRGYLKRPRSDFFKNRPRFKKIFSLIFVQIILLFHDSSHHCVLLEV